MEPTAMEPQVGEKRPLDDESSMVEAQVGEAQVGEKRPLDDVRGCSSRVLPPPQNIQVESINQAIAQHQAVIQTQSDISQVLGTVSTSLTALVSALDGGYPADRQTVQAVVSQVETLRAIFLTDSSYVDRGHRRLLAERLFWTSCNPSRQTYY